MIQAGILSSSSNFVATIAALCNKHSTVKNVTITFTFSPSVSTLTDLSGNIAFLQPVLRVTSVGCNWLISIHVVDFVPW